MSLIEKDWTGSEPDSERIDGREPDSARIDRQRA